jgi:copper homeostasis protein CutC
MAKTKNKFVLNIEHLKELIKAGHTNYAIILGGGIGLYSRKTIKYNEKSKKFSIINHIDESRQSLDEEQIRDREYTMIAVAIPKKCLVAIID